MMVQPLHYSYELSASPKMIYGAFTNSIMLRSWLCDITFIDANRGHAYLFIWNNGYVVSGKYETRQHDKVVFSWYGSDEPGTTRVEVSITPQGEGTHLEVTHTGFGEGEAWETCVTNLDLGWKSIFPNLLYYLETGLDERVVRRPLLGVNIGDLTEELSTNLGLPTRDGVFLLGTAEGMGAQAAGLGANDLIVRIAEHDVNDYGTLLNALKGKKGGDTVEVEFYRGADKHTVQMRLSERPLPQIVESAEAMAALLLGNVTELHTELDTLLGGVSNEEGATRPSPDDWSVNENLAHLIFSERFSQMDVWGLVSGDNTFIWTDNNVAQLSPILSAYPTTDLLIAEFKRTLEGSVAQMVALPADTVADRPRMIVISQQVMGSAGHIREHYRQMHNVLAALRGEATPA